MVVDEVGNLITTVNLFRATRIDVLAAFVDCVYGLSLRSPQFEPFFYTFFNDFNAIFFPELRPPFTRLLFLFFIS